MENSSSMLEFAPTGSQTLLRGLDVIEAVAAGPIALPALAKRLGLSRSTAHRLAAALVERRYLSFQPRLGYRLGAKLLDLGSCAQRQLDLVQVARPHLEALVLATGDTVHMGIRLDDEALYLDKLTGRRRIEISSRIGERQPLTTTGLGKALLLDASEADWRAQFETEQTGDIDTWLTRMAECVLRGTADDLEENEDSIRCVAAPFRAADGKIAGAISVSGAAQYMNDTRMIDLRDVVAATAGAISADLGWSGIAGES